MSRGGNIQGIVHLQNQNYLVTEMALKIPIIVIIIVMKIMMKYNSIK